MSSTVDQATLGIVARARKAMENVRTRHNPGPEKPQNKRAKGRPKASYRSERRRHMHEQGLLQAKHRAPETIINSQHGSMQDLLREATLRKHGWPIYDAAGAIKGFRPIPKLSYLTGRGKQGVLGLHRSMAKQRLNDKERRERGRFAGVFGCPARG